jgi:uncharacterized OB-fold protein
MAGAAAGTAAARLLPVDDDHDTGGFWAAAKEHQLVVRACTACGAILHVPRAYCHTCGSWEGHWRRMSGHGRVYSWTTVEHQVHPAYPAPYTVVLVELIDAPGVRLVGYLPGAPELAEGQPMRVWFEELDDGVVLPQWEPERQMA